MSNLNTTRSEVEQIIRTSEILAVARALQAGNQLRVGETIDYFIEPEVSRSAICVKPSKNTKPYRVPVEQWHLDAAIRMLEQWRQRGVPRT